MATVTKTLAGGRPATGFVHHAVFTWTPLANGDDGGAVDAAEFSDYADRSVQILGTFGVGGTVVLEGSNDGTNYVTLRDPQGVALSFTAAGLKAVLEMTKLVRPRVTAGDGTTSLTVVLFARKTL